MSNRFYFPDRFFRVRDQNNLLAYFSFVDNETGLEYSNWRLLNGRNGVFVSSPFETYEHPDKGPQYYNYVKSAYDGKVESNRSAKGDQYLNDLAEAAHEVYQKLQNTAGVASGSGRGPVEDEDDELPF